MEKRMQKIYTSTRNKDIKRTPKEAILAGMADDGGLYVYDGLDEVKLPIRDMRKCRMRKWLKLFCLHYFRISRKRK